MTTDAATTVKVLLDAAKLQVSPRELDRFVALYPALRAQADALYLPGMDAECPALAFDPKPAFAGGLASSDCIQPGHSGGSTGGSGVTRL
jgi:hypothetical protein